MVTTQKHVRRATRAVFLAGALGAAGPGLAACAADGAAELGADVNGDLTSEGVAYAPIQFAPCAQAPSIECGTLNVPVDYRAPHDERFDVAVVRARATGPGPRIGVLFVNPGGPGDSGVDSVVFGLDGLASLRARFDVISLDPRGVGLSRPVVCDFQPEAPPTGASDAVLEEFFDAIGPAFLHGCLAANGPFVTQVNTTNVARDIDALRAALREPAITYLAQSYGTILGASYAALFPRRVRAMVLDAALPPEWFADYLVELRNDGAAAGELTLARIDALCAADPACPLRAQGVIDTLDRVVAKLDAHPVTSDDGEVVLDGAAVLDAGVNATFYDEAEGWPFYVRALAGSARGDHRLFLQFLQDAKAEQASAPVDDPVGSAFYAVLCSDSGTRRGAADYLPAFRAGDAAFAHFSVKNPSSHTGFFTPPVEAAAACAAWPRREPPPLRQVAARVEPPIVLIGNDFDHATPLPWTRSLATALGAEDSLIRYQGGGHTIYGSSPCVDDAVDAYLFDLVPPPAGLSCPANPVAFGAPDRPGAVKAPLASVLGDARIRARGGERPARGGHRF